MSSLTSLSFIRLFGLTPDSLKKSVNQIRIEYQRLKSLHRKWYAILFHHYLSGIDGRE